MKSDMPKKVVKMLWEVCEVAKTTTTQNVIASAKANDIKITHEDLQKLAYLINSSIEKVSIDSTRNFETRLESMVESLLEEASDSKSDKKAK